MYHLHEVPSKVKFMNKVEQWLLETGERGNGELLLNGYRGSVRDDEKVWKMDNGDSCTTIQMYLMSLNCTLENC